jgi:hypothetical protein
MTREQALRSMVRSYHGAENEFTGNIATEYGVQNEDGARWQYELESGNTVTDASFIEYEDWLGASPDGYIGEDGLIEIKCPFSKKIKPIADQPHYYSQIQIQLLVTGRTWCDFYTWTPTDTNIERIEIDQEWLDKYLPELRQFYAFYLSELDNPEHLEPLRAEINSDETRRMIDELDQLKEAIENATERRKEVQEELVKAVGERNATAWGRKITKVEKEGSVSYAKIVKEYLPDLDLSAYKGKASSYWKIT